MAAEQPDVFVLTPAYNAALTLEDLFARFPDTVRERAVQFVVVNDGSADDTGDVLERMAAREPKLAVIHHPENRGYGVTETTLLQHALAHGAGAAILIHADGQYAPEKIPEIIGLFDRDEADLVQGSRMLGGGALEGGMPKYKYIANKCLTAIENLAFGMRMAEYHSGYMAYNRPCLERIPFASLSHSFDFDLEMIVLAHTAGLRIREIAIPTRYAGEVSHLNPVTYGLRVLKVVGKHLRGDYRRLLARPADLSL